MVFHTFSRCVQGARHRSRELQDGKEHPCQDFCECGGSTASGKKGVKREYVYIAAADGHGDSACFRSAKGAEFAVMAVRYICKSVAEKYPIERLFEPPVVAALAKEFVSVWNTLVHVDVSASPFSESELASVENARRAEQFRAGRQVELAYGTTLLGAFFCGDGWFAFQIGDGTLTIKDKNGGFSQPVPADERCFMNQTTSMCDENAASEIRFYVSTDLPQAVFCATDGLDGSFNTREQLTDFYTKLLWLYDEYIFDACAGCEKKRCSRECRNALAEEEIASYLPTLSSRGSGDDISLAICLCRDRNSVPARKRR